MEGMCELEVQGMFLVPGLGNFHPASKKPIAQAGSLAATFVLAFQRHEPHMDLNWVSQTECDLLLVPLVKTSPFLSLAPSSGVQGKYCLIETKVEQVTKHHPGLRKDRY